MQRVFDSEFATHLPAVPIGEARGGFLSFYTTVAAGLQVRSENGRAFAQGLIRWVIGAGRQGQTPIVEQSSRSLEHRISFYSDQQRYGLTMGHQPGISHTAEEALGRSLPRDELRRCLTCHNTELTSDLQPRIIGIQCARCHPGSAEHALGHGLPLNPGKLSAAAQVQFCGTCHRVSAPDGNDADPINVRFQPMRLTQSKCYLAGSIRCTTCHPAHMDAVRNDHGFYNQRCSACHADEACRRKERSLTDCIGCHMPRSEPQPHLAFTDHWIGIPTNQAFIFRRPAPFAQGSACSADRR